MRIALVNGVQIHWQEDGQADGPVLVFANSLGTDLRLWDKVIDNFVGRYRIIRFDKRGHGLSACPNGPYSIDTLAQDAAALLDHLGVTRCSFVGLSIGGMIAQALAAQRPDLVSAVVLSNTAAKMGEATMWHDRIAAIEAGGIQALADPIMDRWFSEAFRATDELTAWRNMLIRTPQAGYLGCCHAIAGADLTEQTRQLDVPCLGIAGSVDGSSPPELVQDTVRMIKGAEFKVIEGAGHLPCVEAPEVFSKSLADFLKETQGV